MSCVKLCFQVFLEGPKKGEFKMALAPVVSNKIYDEKAYYDLSIIKLSHYSAVCTGGSEIILLCKKVQKHDIKIRFSEEGSDWKAFGSFSPHDVHMQSAITFKTPEYKRTDITAPVKLKIELQRVETNDTSEAVEFMMTPVSSKMEKFFFVLR